MSNSISSTISLTAWCGATAGFVGAVLAGKSAFNITLVAANVSFTRAAFIGGGSIGLAFSISLFAIDKLADQHSAQEGKKKFLKDWSWILLIPLAGVPYIAGVPLLTGITLVGLGALGGIAKHFLVGAIPEPN
jgi:hypothetical protein